MATTTVNQPRKSTSTAGARGRGAHVLPFPGLQLVPSAPPPVCSETVEAIERLLESARSGHVVGIAFAAMFEGSNYMVRTTGALRNDPTLARGAVATLDDELRELVHDNQG